MKNRILLPNKYKVFGWILFLTSTVLGYFCLAFDFKINGFQIYLPPENEDSPLNFADYNLTNELAFLGITIGLLMVVFAKEKIEDEYISHLRLKSLQWAVLISYAIILILNFSSYGLSFAIFMIYNTWTTLILFIIIFNWNLYRSRKEAA